MEKANITTMEIRESSRIKLTIPMEIIEPLEDVVTSEYSDIVLECKAKGFEEPIWLKNGVEIEPSYRINAISDRDWHRLEIKSVITDDHGVYSIVSNSCGCQISSDACLFVAPNTEKYDCKAHYTDSTARGNLLTTKQLTPVRTRRLEDINLSMEFENAVVKECIWFKNNDRVIEDRRTKLNINDNSCSLCISEAEITDSGIYHAVIKTKYDVISKYAPVVVTDVDSRVKVIDQAPFIEETLPDELEVNENEEIRLICKASFNQKTEVKWFRNGIKISKKNMVPESYGNQFLGLRIFGASKSDTGDYAIILIDGMRMETSNCYLTVNPCPIKSLPEVEVHRHMESVVATLGSKVCFDCSFNIQDPRYYYVVWYIGHYRIERTNSRFHVTYRGGDFLLYIRKLEPDMLGEVVCELRRALPNQRSVLINSTSAHVAILPPSVLALEGERDPIGRIHRELYSKAEKANGYNGAGLSSIQECAERKIGDHNRPQKGSNGYVCVEKYDVDELILDIDYCRLDEEGVYYLRSTSSRDGARLVVYNKAPDPTGQCRSKIVFMEWEEPLDLGTWYSIEVCQPCGRYLQAGLSSVPGMELVDPPVGRLMGLRVRAVLPDDASDARVCITASPNEILQPPKNHVLKQMDHFEMTFSKTGDLLGCGAFGSVFLVADSSDEHYAAKVLKTRTQKKRDTAVREFEMMRRLRHPKLVELHAAFTAKDCFILVMDYLWGGELFDRIVEEDHIKEVDVVPYVRQMCEALQYLHAHKIAHLDLKPENIICLSPNSTQVKIIDFGLARVLDEGNVTRAIYGTRDYVAPEVLNFERLTLACDMWSLGVVTYMLLSGVMPFAGESWPERSANITMANYDYHESAFKDISDLAKDFVDQLLLLNADARMSASVALNHKWIVDGPPKGAKAAHMKRARENLKSYLANYRARWQRAGNVMIAAHRLRTQANSHRNDVTANNAATVT